MSNLKEPTFIMLCGLPGSGKSTYAEKLQKYTWYNNTHECIVHSSDKIREELNIDSTDRSSNSKVFQELHKRVKDDLKKGHNVVYDATNINRKRRTAFLKELKNIPCYKVCTIVLTEYKNCIKNNLMRDNSVPIEVIKRMYKSWNTPYYFEGWNNITLEYNDPKCHDVIDFLWNYFDYKQNNIHHQHTLGLHSALTGLYCKHPLKNKEDKDQLLLVYSGFLHDIGKPFCKTYDAYNNAHYYRHENVSAYDSFFYKLPDGIDCLDLSILINLHMIPFKCNAENDRGKIEYNYIRCKKKYGEDLFVKIMRLHGADLRAGTNVRIMWNH